MISKLQQFVDHDSVISKAIIIYERKEGPKHCIAIRFDAVILSPPFKVMREIDMITLTDIQKVSLSITPVDAAGNPAPVEGAPLWESSSPNVVSLEVAEDGLSAVATAAGPLGTSQILVTADADLGEGVVTISGTLDVMVIASQAVGMTITPGVPEPK